MCLDPRVLSYAKTVDATVMPGVGSVGARCGCMPCVGGFTLVMCSYVLVMF